MGGGLWLSAVVLGRQHFFKVNKSVWLFGFGFSVLGWT
jgi:hypothetical protein